MGKAYCTGLSKYVTCHCSNACFVSTHLNKEGARSVKVAEQTLDGCKKQWGGMDRKEAKQRQELEKTHRYKYLMAVSLLFVALTPLQRTLAQANASSGYVLQTIPLYPGLEASR